MHILLIHQAFAALDQPGGTRHHEMACYLAERGHRVTVIASPVSYLTGKRDFGSGRHEIGGPGDRITIIRTYTYSALHRSFVHRVISFLSFMVSSFFAGLNVRDVDILWGTSPPIFQSVTAWLLAVLKRTPFMLEVRDLWPAFAIEVGVLRNPLLIRASEWLERFLYDRAERVVVNSPGFIDHVRERGVRWVELVPNGSDTGMFNPSDHGEAFREKYSLHGKFIALYAGAHGMSNDLDIVIQAAGILDEMEDIQFILLGDGKEKAGLQEQADAMGLGNVLFIPPLPKKEIAEALAASDTCIAILKPVPLYRKVYPNKVFDYMAAGRPVVLAIDGVVRDVVEAADAGVFVEPGDPSYLADMVHQLSVNPERCRQMGQNGRRLVEERFDRSLQAEQLALILEKMVDEAPKK